MSEVFSARSLMYWWAALSATVFLKDWLKNLAAFVRSSDLFAPDKLPFNLIPGVNGWIDQAAEAIRTGIKFKPEQELAAIGPVHIQSWTLAVAVGCLFLGLGIGLYIRSLNSSTWFDDFLALFVIYGILRIEGHIVAVTQLPIKEQFRSFVNNPTTAFVLLLVLLLALVFFGEGIRSRRAFWRAFLEVIVLAVFMFPRNTALAISGVILGLSQFGTSLAQFTPFAIIWGMIGMFLAIQRLLGHEHTEVGRG